MDHKIKIPTFGHKHNLLSRNQSKVRTVGYGGGRVSVTSFISSPIIPDQLFTDFYTLLNVLFENISATGPCRTEFRDVDFDFFVVGTNKI